MQFRLETPSRRQLLALVAALGIAALVFALRRLLAQVGMLVLGAALLCFITVPIARWYERHLPRAASALLALMSMGAAIGLLAGLLLPAIYRQMLELARAVPDSIARLADWASGVRLWLQSRLPALSLPALSPANLAGPLSGIAEGTVNMAVNLADVVGQSSMMAVLAFFFLCDRDRLLLRLELLVPQSGRHAAVGIANAIGRELRLYLRGQLMVAGAVSVLSVAALWIVGVPSALALGLIIGLLNMIPYFGPFIGGVPAVFIALSMGWQKAALTVLALTVVQQLDGSWISPRIMGGVTGFSPAAVLVGIFAGARLKGVAGMIFALPVMMALRTVFRFFVQKYENI